ncbi:MAG: NDP-sugar synthase [Polyangiaceae bacterium]|nr:NDP-sugar synthase [Polyangiaceae bacterium]
MILAAGYGTRLRPLTDELPKPLLPVGDRPAVHHVALALARVAERVILNTHHRPEAFDGLSLPLPHVALCEPRILGTAGGVANARALLGDGDVVVWNGDILAPVDLAALLSRRRVMGALAAWVVAPRARGEGTVGVSEDGLVVRVRGTTVGEEARGGDFLGVSALSPAAVASLPGEGCLVGDVVEPALRRGARVAAAWHEGPWDDIGTVRSYAAANARWLGARPQFVAPSARVAAGCDVRGSIVGDGAVVRAAVRGSIVLPGAEVDRPVERAVVTARGTIVPID